MGSPRTRHASTAGSGALSADVFQAIADDTRRRILRILAEGERSVSDLAGEFTVTRPAISQHLRVLRDAGLVRVRQEGRTRFYRPELEPLGVVVDWLGWFEGFWDDKLASLTRYLEDGG